MCIKKIDHFVITTANIIACCDFYQKLGFRIETQDGRYAFFAGDFKINVHIKGSELSPHAQHVTVGSADFCFEISGAIDTFKQHLIEQHIEIELGVVPRSGTNGIMESIYLRDPDGNLLEFSSYE